MSSSVSSPPRPGREEAGSGQDGRIISPENRQFDVSPFDINFECDGDDSWGGCSLSSNDDIESGDRSPREEPSPCDQSGGVHTGRDCREASIGAETVGAREGHQFCQDSGGSLSDQVQALIGPAVLLAIRGKEKKPILKAWQKQTMAAMTPNYLAGLYHQDNLGVLLGRVSNGLCTLDCDLDDGFDEMIGLNPSFSETLQTRGNRGGNVWLRILGDFPQTKILKTVEGQEFGEWRSDKNQTVIHGVHPTGCRYRHNNHAVMEIPFDQIVWPANVVQPWLDSAPASGAVSSSVAEPTYPLNDTGRAARFVDRFEHDIRYVPERKFWLTWSGGKWCRETDGAVNRLAIQLTGEMLETASQLGGISRADQQVREFSVKEALACGDVRNIRDFLELAKVDARILLPVDRLDADPWSVAAPNAIIDLKTGVIRDFTREDFTTRELGVAADPHAVCHRWRRFMVEIFPDEQVRHYLHKALGYSLTGITSEQVFFFFHGSGRNGKSKTVEAVQKVMGTYGIRVGKGVIAANRRSEYPKGEVAELAGARFAFCSETAENERMNEEVIKDLTGGDILRGERKYENGFQFRPECKLWVSGNHKPSVSGTEYAIWRRVRLIPFTQCFEGADDDRDLSSALSAEASGILNWLIEGCLLWQGEGLEPPPAIRCAVEAYRTEEDTLADFIGENIVERADSTVAHSRLFSVYQQYCAEGGIRNPLSRGGLAKKLRNRGWRDRRTGGEKVVWQGIGLVEG